ncbi:hypothetical protein ACTFIR_009818 [Dictyostelium discoideum]
MTEFVWINKLLFSKMFLTNYEIKHSLINTNQSSNNSIVVYFPLVTPQNVNSETSEEDSNSVTNTFKIFGILGISGGLGGSFSHSWGQSFTVSQDIKDWDVRTTMDGQDKVTFNYYQNYPWSLMNGNGPSNFNQFGKNTYEKGKRIIPNFSKQFN